MPGAGQIDQAVRILRAGGLVAFATETVYGLGADATNRAAVQRIFALKGRPATNPLIIHVPDVRVARRYATHWPETAQALAQKFWPGPLTLVLPKQSIIVDEATAGLPTLGLRVPDHPVTLELLRRFNGPMTGPSANVSNHLSPTTAAHVREDLGQGVDLILDGGPCRVGIESTVLDLSRPTSRGRILRPGGISREQIEAVIGPVDVFTAAVDPTTAAPGPGMQAKHYAPRAAAFRFDPAQRAQVDAWCAQHNTERWTLLAMGQTPTSPVVLQPVVLRQGDDAVRQCLGMPSAPEGYAQILYDVLHRLDDQHIAIIWIEMPPDEPGWAAVRDRLSRATRTIERAFA
jgi:L-threonylcarbamoyladenylate synthase